jgi:hypothetical protein
MPVHRPRVALLLGGDDVRLQGFVRADESRRSAATPCGLSTIVESVIPGRTARAASRRALVSVTIGKQTKRSVNPASASTSASPILAQVSPTAPASSCIAAICGVLCVLTCGRNATPASYASVAISAMLRSKSARSTITHGVSRPSASVRGDASVIGIVGSSLPVRNLSILLLTSKHVR